MPSTRTPALRLVFVALAAAILLAACGGDDSSDLEAQAVSQAAGTLANPNLSSVVTAIADGFGDLGAAQQRAVAGAASSSEVCDHRADPRVIPEVSQVEVEIVTLTDGCLYFSYDVANFRTLLSDLDRLRRPADVVAVSPLLLEYRLDQNDQRGQSDPGDESDTADQSDPGDQTRHILQTDPSWPVRAIDAQRSLQADAPTGRGIVIAVIDSGIDTSNEAFRDVDVRRVPGSGRGDYTSTGHGTVAARIIVTPIGEAPRAIAPNVQLLDVPADLCDRATCGCDPCAPMTAAEAIRWSTDNGADIISMSFGFRPAPKPAWWQLLLDDGQIDVAAETIAVALAYATANDVAMTAAAGNCAGGKSTQCETGDQFEIPAGHPAVIAVAGLDQDAQGVLDPAWYSTRQAYVELAAPGSVTFTDADGDPLQKIGTSFATPFVAASLAMLAGDDGPLTGHSQPLAQARQILADTALDLAPTGRDSASGHGQIQLDSAALRAAESNIPIDSEESLGTTD